MTNGDAEKALIEELHMLREPFSYSQSLGVRAVNALESQRSRIAALEAVIQKVRDDAADWEKAPRGEMAPCTGVGRYFTRLVSAAPSVVLDGMIREAKAEARAVQPTDREELFQLWLRHGSSFESDHSEGYELADALLAAGWRKETR